MCWGHRVRSCDYADAPRRMTGEDAAQDDGGVRRSMTREDAAQYDEGRCGARKVKGVQLAWEC